MKNKKFSFLMILFLFFISCLNLTRANSKSFILDSDTGNEMDDLYAIVRAVKDPNIKLIGLISAHFNNPQLVTDSFWHIYPTKNINTIQISQELNEEILDSLDRLDIPHPIGCSKMVGYAWGYYPGAQIPTSPGVDFIIEQAKKHSPENKLNIMCIGAVTNPAAAVLQDSTIAENIRVYFLSTKYNVTQKIWNKNSFNARCDPNALDILLNNSKIECVVIPSNISHKCHFNKQRTMQELDQINQPFAPILKRRWEEVNAGDKWIMWDVALVEAFIHPEFATIEKRMTPPENTQRMIDVIIDIDADKMRNDFWKIIKK